jgi:hypothetical protein
MQQHVAVDEHDVVSASSGNGEVSQPSEAKAKMLLPHVVYFLRSTLCKPPNNFSGGWSRTVISDENLIGRRALTAYSGEHGSERIRPLEGRNRKREPHGQ